jgi:hypothetical protein
LILTLTTNLEALNITRDATVEFDFDVDSVVAATSNQRRKPSLVRPEILLRSLGGSLPCLEAGNLGYGYILVIVIR